MPWMIPSHQAPVLPLKRWRPHWFSGLALVLDGFTHGDHSGWALAFLPVLGTPVPSFDGHAPLHDVLQLWLTIGLGALALRDWGRMASTLPAPGPGASAAWEVVPAAPEACRQVVASLVGAALAGAALAPFLKGAIGSPDALKLATYGAISFAALAAVIGAVADRARRAVGRVLLDVGPSLGA